MRSTCCVMLSLLLLLALRGTAGAVEIGTNFWGVGWGGEVNDPFETTHKNVQGENPWNTEFLNEIRIYTVFRFMDWGKTNNAVEAHERKTRWEDRVQKSDLIQRPMAYEWMIDLCNRTQRDMWVCVPHFADEHYMYQLACLIRDSLDPSLRCYAEWSNETWNGRNALLDAIDVAELTRVQRRSVNHWNSGEFGYKDLLRR